MELSEFITETIKGIIKGVKDSQEFAVENNSRVNPHIGSWDKKTSVVYFKNENGAKAISDIAFDIAVTVSAQSEISGKAGINVFSFALGGGASDKDKNETISRIKFSISIALPACD